jgi:hypothetical protein
VALILVTETAWGGVFGWSAAGVWPVREVAGAITMFAGLIISEALAAFAPRSEHVVFEPAVEGMPTPLVETPERPSATSPEHAESTAAERR